MKRTESFEPPVYSVSSAVSGDNKGSEKSKKALPLRFKLIGFFLLFAFAMLILLWLFQIVFLDDFYRMIKTEQLKACTSSVASNLNSDGVTELIDDIREHNNMNVAVYDTSNSIFIRLYSSNSIALDILPHEVYTYYNNAKRNGSVLVISEEETYSDIFDKYGDTDIFDGNRPLFDQEHYKSLACAAIVRVDDNTEYMVVLKTQITPVSSTVETLYTQLIIITVVIVLAAVIFAVVVSSRISKPLAKTNENAKQLADRNYKVEFEGSGCREICELCDTLNYARAELSTVDDLRRELIANISHDLRTPLTMITGYAELMRDIPGENTAENLQIVIDETERLSALVTDLLDLSKLEASTEELHKEYFSLTECIKSIFARYQKLIASDGYNIEFEYDRDVEVFGDELRMTQVIYNLINNAVNYSGDDKTVIVRQTVKDNIVRVEVTDHGNGIAGESLAHIWDRYYRVDKEHKSAKIGTGLGLSIVKNILTLHNSHFGVTSAIGRGSSFWFELEVPSVRA